MSYVKTNVTRPTGNSGNGGDQKDLITLFDWADVTSGYTRDDKGIVMAGPLVFSAGTYAIKLYGTQDTIKTDAESSGDTDAEGVIQTVEFSHPGNQQAIKEFRQNWLGKSVGIVIERCSDGTKTLYGAPCAPLRLAFKSPWDKDKNTAVLTFKSAQKGPDVATYTGTITYDTVKATVAANATSIDVTNGSGEYQLTTGSASAATITTLSNAVDGAVYTILGSGGTYPSLITKANDFILSNGTTWTGSAGAKLQVRAFKSDTAAWKYIEISRV